MNGTTKAGTVALAAAGAMLLLAGCAGGVLIAGPWLGSALLVLSLLLHGCSDGRCADYDVCEYGEVHVENLCCAEGDSCNYGMPITICDDGTCRQAGGSCPESALDAGSGAVEPDSGLVDACCPNMDCSFGMSAACGDAG